ncbi:hypothetical protein [Floridanema evergladense]|uniref:Uncharacterized protein n=1 Tax=Floridaenema evergladense BLCC-F167 TaxID=3153639 RepID=A0ABV4WGD3_9CYAN
MTEQMPAEKEEKLLEILELAKIGEQKMKEASEMATAMAEKYQRWYEEGMARKQKEKQVK